MSTVDYTVHSLLPGGCVFLDMGSSGSGLTHLPQLSSAHYPPPQPTSCQPTHCRVLGGTTAATFPLAGCLQQKMHSAKPQCIECVKAETPELTPHLCSAAAEHHALPVHCER